MRLESVSAERAVELQQQFMLRVGSSLSTFRYFSSVDFKYAVCSHKLTLFGFEDDDTGSEGVIAYGHLDDLAGQVWLGVCVAQHHRGQGLGRQVVQRLLDFADEQRLDVLLSVDLNNTAARALYEKFGFVEVLRWGDRCKMRRICVADTLGSLVDKLATVNNKMFVNQELLYEIRRMTFEEYKAKYFSDENGARQLWETLKRACDLNVQRNQLIVEVDEKVAAIAKAAAAGKDTDDGANIQRPHKTY